MKIGNLDLDPVKLHQDFRIHCENICFRMSQT